MFFTLWAIQDGFKRGMNPGESMARYGIMIIIMNTVSLIAAPIFGTFIDRVNRVTALIVALCFASAGYLSMGLITSPLDFAMAPYFIIISMGSGFMMKSSLSLVGQEAPIRERGSVVAMAGMFGAIGILIFTKWGGILFDDLGSVGPVRDRRRLPGRVTRRCDRSPNRRAGPGRAKTLFQECRGHRTNVNSGVHRHPESLNHAVEVEK